MNYSTLVYPLTPEGEGYTRPELPSTFLNFFASSPTWNPYSTNEIDRTEYWEDTEGTLALDEVQLAVYGLEGMRDQQITILQAAYEVVVSADVSYVSEGSVTKDYQVSAVTIESLMYAMAGCLQAGATPTNYFWLSSDNTQVPFTYNDLKGLAAAMFSQGAPAFAHLQEQKTAVRAATTVLSIQAIVW